MNRSLSTGWRWLKRILGFSIFLILFTFTWGSIQIPLLRMRYDDQKKEVGETVAANFPVLVLTPAGDGAHAPWIIYYSELAQFQRDHPEHSFLVSEEERSDLWQQVFSWGRDDLDLPAVQARFWGPSFSVNDGKQGRQRIKVDARVEGEDDINVGWYEATADSVTPLFHQSYNPRYIVVVEAIDPVSSLLHGFAISNE